MFWVDMLLENGTLNKLILKSEQKSKHTITANSRRGREGEKRLNANLFPTS